MDSEEQAPGSGPPVDPWICRIPRDLLQGMAASPAVGRRSRVLMALLAKLYENFTRDHGVADVSLAHLAAQTGLDVRTVRVVLADLRRAGILHDVSAPAGRIKTLQLRPCADSAQGARIPSPDGLRAGSVRKSAQGTEGRKRAGYRARNPRTPVKERRNEELSLGMSALRTDVEELCLYMASSVERRGAKRPTITAGWRTDARLMLDRDHRRLEEAVALIDWVERDSFWSSNVLSIPTLREKFDRLALKARRTNGSTRPATDLSKYDVHEAAQAARTGQ